MASAVVGTKIYFVGGLATSGLYRGTNGAYSFDTATGEWKNLTSLSYNRYGMTGATDGEKIWIFGGYDDREPKIYYYSVYTIASDVWETNNSSTYIAFCSAQYFADTGKVVIMYGYAPALSYDPMTNEFEALQCPWGDLQYAVGAGSVAYDNKMWLSAHGGDLTSFRTVSSDAQTWETKASNPNGLVYAGLVRVKDVMLTFGGNDNLDEQGLSYDRISMYNITSDTWSVLDATLPMSLQGATAVLVGPNIYLFGGLSNPDGTATLNDKYWIVPCVYPEACQFGCDPSGVCSDESVPQSIPDGAPIDTPSGSAPMVGSSPQTSPVSTPVRTPSSRTSGAVVHHLSIVIFSVLSLCIVLA